MKKFFYILNFLIFSMILNSATKQNSPQFQQTQTKNYNEELAIFNFGNMMSVAATGISAYNIGLATNAIKSSSINFENDTASKPELWERTKLKYWEIIAVIIFMERERQELKKASGSDGEIKNFNSQKTPFGKMDDSKNILSKIVVNLLNVVENIAENIGKIISNILSIFLLLMTIIEVLIGIFKGIFEKNKLSIISILKNMFPQIVTSGIVVSLLANSFFWNFYTGSLFSFSMKVGEMLVGKNFNMQKFPKYLEKLFEIPFSIIMEGIKMFFSIKGVVNNIMPIILLFTGILFLYFIFCATKEIILVLLEYLIIGCIFMSTIVFSVLKITKNIGVGAIKSIIYAITNVILMFLLIGITFSLTENIEKIGISNVTKLFETILTLYIVVLLLMKIKEIGQFIFYGKIISVDGNSMITTVNKPARVIFRVVKKIFFKK